MTLKYNYNNPIMGKYLKMAQNKADIHKQVSSATRGVRGHRTNGQKFAIVRPRVTHNVYYVNKDNQSSMSTMQKVTAGLNIFSAGLSGAAEIIKAIKETSGSKPTGAAASVTSTTTDNTSYSTGKPSGSSSALSMAELSESSKSSKPAKSVTTLQKSIDAYKEEGNNVKDRSSLEKGITKAKGRITDIDKEIQKNQDAYDSALTKRDEYKKTMEEDLKSYDTKIEGMNTKIKELNIGDASSGLTKELNDKTKAYEDVKTEMSDLDEKLNKGEIGQTEYDYQMNQLTQKLSTAEKEKNDADTKLQDAIKQRDKLNDDIAKETKNKEKAETKHKKELENLESKLQSAAKKPGVKDSDGAIADNSLQNEKEQLTTLLQTAQSALRGQ